MKDMVCEHCNKEYDVIEEEEIFSFEIFDYEYSNLTQDLCAKCAIESISNSVEGMILVECDECGTQMDYQEEISNYSIFGNLDCSLEDFSRRLCSNCAINLENSEFPSEDEF